MKLSSSSRRRRPSAASAATVLVCGLLLAGCQADPGDAPTVDDADGGQDLDGADGNGGDGGEEGDAVGDNDVPTVPEELRTISVGVDSVPADLNPHLVSSRSMVTSAVADLTLPSAFTVGDDGRRTELNSALLESVEVVEGDEDAPTSVRYVLAGVAQWSDGTPISGSDFDYLRTQLVTAPGASATAGYTDIEDLVVSAGGSTVTVDFSRPQPDWRELFAHLLPSHIYGSEGRSFSSLMETLPAASGGVYTVRQFDPGRGHLVLERNTRYWGETPARTDRIELSDSGDLPTATQMLRTGQFQMLTSSDGAVVEESLDTVPTVGTRTVDLGTRLDLVPNTAAGRLGSPEARQALLSTVDADQVARLVSGDPGAGAPEDVIGSQNGAGDPADALAGTEADPLRIAADTLDDGAVESARRVVDQLVNAGVPATVVTPTSADLFSSFLPRGDVDAVVVRQDRERTVTDLRSAYSCDQADRPVTAPSQDLPTESDMPTTEDVPAADPTDPTETSASAETTATDAPTTTEPGNSQLTARAANVSGVCDDELDDLLDQGAFDRAVDRINDLALGLPLIDDRTVIARSPLLLGPPGSIAQWPTDEWTGPFVTAGQWYRVGDPDEVDGTDTTGDVQPTDGAEELDDE